MGYTRGKFGLEYDSSRMEPETPWLRWAITLVVVLAVGSLAVRAVVKLFRAPESDFLLSAEAGAQLSDADNDVRASEPSTDARSAAEKDPRGEEAPIKVEAATRRPEVKVLLAKMDTARRKQAIEMEVAAIERLRALPGNPAADLDDVLAQRLGELNLKWLFKRHSAQWTKVVEVRRGDSASRIARTYGATLASMEKLNGDVSKIRIGQKLCVMDHPHFSLTVYRVTRIADLFLNGKFFKRYRLAGAVGEKPGAYATSDRLRNFFAEKGIQFSSEDRAELEIMLPAGTPVVISEFR